MIEIISVIALAICVIALVIGEVVKKYLENISQAEFNRYQVELTQLQLQQQEELSFSKYKE